MSLQLTRFNNPHMQQNLHVYELKRESAQTLTLNESRFSLRENPVESSCSGLDRLLEILHAGFKAAGL